MSSNFDFGNALSRAFMGEQDESEQARHDFAVFLEKVVTDDNTGEVVEVQPFQREVIEVINKHSEITLIVLPRGFSKSTLMQAYCAWLIGRDPNIRIIIASNTEDQAIARLTGIEEILKSAAYQEIFGDLIPPPAKRTKWSETVKTVLRDRRMSHATLRGVGAGGSKAVGQRADLLVIDDIIDPESANSPTERQRVWDWMMGALRYVQKGVRNPRMIVVNTRYHEDDVAGRLRVRYKQVNDESRFVQIDRPALVTDPVSGDEVSIWEDYFPADKLKEDREINYFHFQTHSMNDPINTEDSKLQEEWLNWVDEDVLRGADEHMTYHFGIDPNTGEADIKNDNFAIVVVGTNANTNNVYVVDMYYAKDDIKTIKERFKAMYLRYKPESIYLESNAAQILYKTLFSDEDQYEYPFIAVPSSINKLERIQAMSNHFIAGRISTLGRKDVNGRWIAKDSLEPLRREWLTFPQSKDSHFDALDALTFAIQPIMSYMNEYAVSVITKQEFEYRVKLEQALREARGHDVELAERIEETLRELDLIPDTTPPEEAHQTGECVGCKREERLHVDTDHTLCYDCYLEGLRQSNNRLHRPTTLFGTVGSWSGQRLTRPLTGTGW